MNGFISLLLSEEFKGYFISKKHDHTVINAGLGILNTICGNEVSSDAIPKAHWAVVNCTKVVWGKLLVNLAGLSGSESIWSSDLVASMEESVGGGWDCQGSNQILELKLRNIASSVDGLVVSIDMVVMPTGMNMIVVSMDAASSAEVLKADWIASAMDRWVAWVMDGVVVSMDGIVVWRKNHQVLNVSISTDSTVHIECAALHVWVDWNRHM